MNKRSFNQYKLPLRIATDAQGPMGIVDADGRAVVWLTNAHYPTKGYAWHPEGRHTADPYCYLGATCYRQRKTVVLLLHQLLTKMASPAEDAIARSMGFQNALELYHLIATRDLDTPEKLTAFKAWQNEDGTKKGILKLPEIPPKAHAT